MKVSSRVSLMLLALGAAPSLSVQAGISLQTDEHDCDVESAYSLNLEGEGIAFDSDKATPKHVRIDKGRLYIDGREIELNGHDRSTIRQIEGEVRNLTAEAVVIASDGVDLAFDALSEVSKAFIEDSSRQASLERSMEKTRGIIQNQIRDAVLHRPFDERAFEALIESQIEKLASELIQVVIGEFVPRAINAALSGDEKAVADIEARAQKLEADIERRIERKANEIGRRAEKLCPRVRALVAMQSNLGVRLDNGERLILIEE